MTSFEVFGQIVESEFELPAVAASGRADLSIVGGKVATPGSNDRLLARVESPGLGHTIHASRDGTIVSVPELFRFLIRDAEIVVDILEGDEALAPILIVGSILAIKLTLEGRCVLHGSAVAEGSDAIAFIGAPGRGKSTLAGVCCAAGAAFVTDDVLLLRETEEGFSCVPSGTHLRLRPAAAELAQLVGEPLTSADGRTTVAPRSFPEHPRLRAVFFPNPVRDRPTLEVHKLAPKEALIELTRYPRLLGWSDPDVLRTLFAWNAKLSREVPCYRAVIPWGPPFDPALADDLARVAQIR